MKTLGFGVLALSAADAFKGGAFGATAGEGEVNLGQPVPYELPMLPYAYNALEPYIKEEVLHLHHEKHHAGYVKGFNKALERLEKSREDAEQITPICRDLAFHGSGHVLHTLYWSSMKPGGGDEPQGVLRAAIERDFGSVKGFMTQFANAAKMAEASAWALLAFEPMGRRLLILQAEKHQNLTVWGVVPIMVCDVWEHAYYLQYQNRRPEYVDNFMKVVDWQASGQRLQNALARYGQQKG